MIAILISGLVLGSFLPEGLGREELRGAYLGQSPPGEVPEIFAPGMISTEVSELNCAFTPDLKEVYFTVRREGVNTIMVVRLKGGLWADREVVEFSGKYSDVDPFVSSDGKRLYFSSMRPLADTEESTDSNLWYVERAEDGGWGHPVFLKGVNSPGKDDYYTSIDHDGTLYFSIFDTHGSPGDIYMSKSHEGEFGIPQRDPSISQNGSYLIFTSDRPDGMGRGDLYISFRTREGSWSPPRNMGKSINTEGYEYGPLLSPDGKYLFFTRYIEGQGDIYWVDAKIVESFKP
jgi:Tol biopolymer transport system component